MIAALFVGAGRRTICKVMLEPEKIGFDGGNRVPFAEQLTWRVLRSVGIVTPLLNSFPCDVLYLTNAGHLCLANSSCSHFGWFKILAYSQKKFIIFKVFVQIL